MPEKPLADPPPHYRANTIRDLPAKNARLQKRNASLDRALIAMRRDRTEQAERADAAERRERDLTRELEQIRLRFRDADRELGR